MIRVDAVWLAVLPVDFRLDADSALAHAVRRPPSSARHSRTTPIFSPIVAPSASRFSYTMDDMDDMGDMDSMGDTDNIDNMDNIVIYAYSRRNS